MDDFVVCGRCKYNKLCIVAFSSRAAWVCDNEDSDNYGLYTAYNDRCEEGEAKE